MKCELTNKQLIDKAKEWVKKLCETGGRAWTLKVPVDLNNDPDIIFSELCNRLDASTPPVSATEWIVCSAIQYFVDDKELVVCGLRHNNCINTYYKLTGKQTSSELEQGFITSTGRFVDRVEAGKIALSCGQIKELKYYGGTKLDSSDLYHCVTPVSAMEDGWVKVEDGFPVVGKIDEGTQVMAYPHYINCHYGEFINARTGNEETGFYSYDGEWCGDIKIHEVTHWRKRLPLPPPPIK